MPALLSTSTPATLATPSRANVPASMTTLLRQLNAPYRGGTVPGFDFLSGYRFSPSAGYLPDVPQFWPIAGGAIGAVAPGLRPNLGGGTRPPVTGPAGEATGFTGGTRVPLEMLGGGFGSGGAGGRTYAVPAGYGLYGGDYTGSLGITGSRTGGGDPGGGGNAITNWLSGQFDGLMPDSLGEVGELALRTGGNMLFPGLGTLGGLALDWWQNRNSATPLNSVGPLASGYLGLPVAPPAYTYEPSGLPSAAGYGYPTPGAPDPRGFAYWGTGVGPNIGTSVYGGSGAASSNPYFGAISGDAARGVFDAMKHGGATKTRLSAAQVAEAQLNRF